MFTFKHYEVFQVQFDADGLSDLVIVMAGRITEHEIAASQAELVEEF